ncbi:hypothetical protein F4823DRAFT_264125 [Ustulina deusta]|nr:hypothetical protein F4823DRAFT_264125 [Ustulina deusta]
MPAARVSALFSLDSGLAKYVYTMTYFPHASMRSRITTHSGLFNGGLSASRVPGSFQSYKRMCDDFIYLTARYPAPQNIEHYTLNSIGYTATNMQVKPQTSPNARLGQGDALRHVEQSMFQERQLYAGK